MKHSFYALFAAAMTSTAASAQIHVYTDLNESNYGDSLVMDTGFVARGSIAPGMEVKFAVTDPLERTMHTISAADSTGRFEMNVPMRGPLQSVYLYVDNVVTLPVCAGDTLDFSLTPDSWEVTHTDAAANLDYRLARRLHEQMRPRYIGINLERNKYIQKSLMGLRQTPETDSIKMNVVRMIGDYQRDCKSIIDTFVVADGAPRLEEYFRISGFFSPLSFIGEERLIDRLPGGYYRSATDGRYSPLQFHDYLMKYPEYMAFQTGRLNGAVGRFLESFPYNQRRIGFNGRLDISRQITPDRFLEELCETARVCAAFGPDGSGLQKEEVQHVIDYVTAPALRTVLQRIYDGIGTSDARAPGSVAPELVMTDADGRVYTLADFRGKYLYLDFWNFGCGPCMEEFRQMPELRELLGDKMERVAVVTVCCSTPSGEELTEFAAKHGMDDLNLILDSERSAKVYNVRAYPAYMLIGPDGRIVEFFTERPSQIIMKHGSPSPSALEKALSSEE